MKKKEVIVGFVSLHQMAYLDSDSFSEMSLSHLRAFVLSCSVMSDSVIPWTVACQAALSMEFSKQEYWSGFTFPPSGGLPDPGIELVSLALAADSKPLSHPGSPTLMIMYLHFEFEYLVYKTGIHVHCSLPTTSIPV